MNLPPYKDYTDGSIVGGVIVKGLEKDDKFTNTIKLIEELSAACKINSN